MSAMRALVSVLAALLLGACAATGKNAQQGQWRSIFNGKNLDGWTPKFAGHPLGENVNDTFRVENGVLKVSYENWRSLDDQFGHLFYKKPFSHYRLRLEYRFTGEQVAGAPDWAFRNNGIMIHAQPPETMALDQAFPDCVEVQLLGGDGVRERPTGNMCSPQSSVVINGKREITHCINSTSKTYHGDQWVKAEVDVRGGDVIRHFINGEQVMEYSAPMLDEARPWHPELEMTSGYIALQAESHPTEFRNIEIMELPD